MFTAFTDEIVRIKVAEEHAYDENRISKREALHALKNLALGAGAYGLGAGGAGLALNYGLPKVLPRLSPLQRAGLSGIAGIAGIAGAYALQKAIQRNKELIRDETKRLR